MRILLQIAATFTTLLALLWSVGSMANDSPRQVIENATNSIISELNRHSADERTDEFVRNLVLAHLAPAMDERRVAMGILGKHWRRANPEQREIFIVRFRDQQIRTYTGAFKAFDGERFTIIDERFNDNGDRAIVRGQLIPKNGQPIPIDFRLYQNPDSQWRVYDAVVAGLGMVRSYRDQLSQRLENTSIAQLLEELENE